MKRLLTTIAVLGASWCTAGLSNAAADEAAATPAKPGVVGKIGHAIEHGVAAAASGVQRGAEAASHGIRTGARAAARGIERAASASSHAVDKAARKVGVKTDHTDAPARDDR